MAILYFSADYTRAAGENPLLCLGIVHYLIVLIDKGNIHRQMGKNEVYLFRCYLTRIKIEASYLFGTQGRNGSLQKGVPVFHLFKPGKANLLFPPFLFPVS